MDGNIIERINESGKRLAVTKTQIAQALTGLADRRDTGGLQLLFSAYCQWELRQSPNEDPTAQLNRCLDNFYVAAQIGDCIKIANGNEASGFAMYNQNPDIVGSTTQFFSAALQYGPI